MKTSPDRPMMLPPFWLALLAGVPVALCTIVMGLPDMGNGRALSFRLFYAAMYLLWTVPLNALQRACWRHGVAWWQWAPTLLLLTYLLSAANNGLAQWLLAGPEPAGMLTLAALTRGLDGCWLALIAFCAINAVLALYASMRDEAERAALAQDLARDAQLRALRYQIDPHFLFNALNGISGLVAADRGRDASMMISRLADFLGATLQARDEHEITVADELAMTESYLDLERARLGPRLAVKTRVGPGALDAKMPAVLIQPLAENAICHGIARNVRGGTLEIQIDRKQDDLTLVVRNTGAAAVGDALLEAVPGIGLRNVRDRLEMLYGDAHRFSSWSSPTAMPRYRSLFHSAPCSPPQDHFHASPDRRRRAVRSLGHPVAPEPPR